VTYECGDYVCPTDLPRRFVCKISDAETVGLGAETIQILKLEPMEGPWPVGTFLIRLDASVVPVVSADRWKRRGLRRSGTAARPAAPRDVQPRGQRAAVG